MKLQYEPLLSHAPPEYVPYHVWPEYAFELNFPANFSVKVIDSNPRGMRRGLWPFFFEEYISDTEPLLAYIDQAAPARFAIWRRISRTDIPKGWYRLSRRPSNIESFIELHPGHAYASSWSKIARNERARWLQLLGTTYAVETISWEQFEDVFRRSSVKDKMGFSYVRTFKHKLERGLKNLVLYGVRDLHTGELIAAMGVVNSPTYQSSFYDIGCKVDSVKDPVMVGLIDHWFRVSESAGFRFLQLGGFWIPGKPKEWKGFSFFKAKFKPMYIQYPPELIRFIPGKFF